MDVTTDKPLLPLLEPYRRELEELARGGRLRTLKTIGDDAINFSSNDYLGLKDDSRLKAAAVEAVERYGTGSGSSRLIAGNNELVCELEEAIAKFKNTEAALVFNSGYQANVAIMQSLLETDDWVFGDKLNHASLVDGMLLSGARWMRYRHLDWAHLENRVQQASPRAKKWIVTDSLFSMDGDYGDLNALCAIAEKHGALLFIDEAHATGVFGDVKSAWLCERFGIQSKVALQMGTFSKALGGFGAYVAGDKILIETLVKKARGLIYSTALPPAVLAGAKAAIEIVQQDFSMKAALWENVRYCHEQLKKAGFEIAGPQTQIIPIAIGDDAKTMQAMDRLLAAGYFVQGIRPPTVPEGTGRLRISLSARHTKEEIDGLVAALVSCVGR